MSKSDEVMGQLGRKLVIEFAPLFNDDGPGKKDRMQDARDRIAAEIRAAASVWAELESALSHECLTSAHHYADLVAIVQLCGGDVEDGDSARECVERVLARAKAPHVRDDRRLKLREGWHSWGDETGTVWKMPAQPGAEKSLIEKCNRTGEYTARHADGSETDHATRLEAHDALIASGSESPFVAVVGVVEKAKVEGGGV